MNQNEFIQLLQAHQGIIYKLVHLYARTAEDKKDLYQEIALQAWKTCANFRGDAAFGTWLYKVSLNTIFTLQRRPNKVVYTDTSGLENKLVTTHSDEAERLYKAIRTLPATDRAIVSLHLDGYGNNEIGEIIGILANAVGVKLHRAKQQLANLLKDI